MSKMGGLILAGALNFRDIGGYRSADGRMVRHGKVYRSGHSSSLTDSDLAEIERLNPRIIVDLHSEREVLAHPPRWPERPGRELIHANIMADLRAGGKSMLDPLIEDFSPAGARRTFVSTYEQLPAECGGIVGTLIHRMAQGELPVIFHCTLGRDRTGFLAAIILHALDVPRDVIMEDYMVTERLLDRAEAERQTVALCETIGNGALSAATLETLVLPYPLHLEAALAVVEADYGSADAYLAAQGIDDDTRDLLKETLLE